MIYHLRFRDEFMNHKYLALGSVGLLFLALVAFLGVFFFSRFEIRQKAVGSENLSMTPANQARAVGEEFTIDLMADADGSPINYVGLDVTYNASLFELVSVVPNTARLPRVIVPLQTSPGRFGILLATNVGGTALTGPGVAATARFRVLAPSSTAAVFSYGTSNYLGTFDPTSETAVNLLKSTSGATVSISGNDCAISFTLTIPSPTPTNTPIPSATPTPTNTPTPTRTPTPTPTRTPTPTVTATPTPTRTPTPTPSNTPTPTPSSTPTPTPTRTPTPTPTNTPTPTSTTTPVPTNTPTNTPTRTPTQTPTNTPVPTNTPTQTPTPTTPMGPQCLAIRIYRDGEYLPDPRVVQPGQTIVIAVAAGPFAERARIWINDVGPTEFSDRNANNEFVYTYTVPVNATSLSIRAEIYANGEWQVSQ